MAKTKEIIIFDGECNFCNYYINKLISIDKRGVYHFASYSSKVAKELLVEYQLPVDFRESFILSKEKNYYMKSSAVIQILLSLSFFWKILGGILWLIPRWCRDMGYNYIAKNRYQISQRYDSCKLPTPEILSRFLD